MEIVGTSAIAFAHAGTGPSSHTHDQARPGLFVLLKDSVISKAAVGVAAPTFHSAVGSRGPVVSEDAFPTIYASAFVHDTRFDGTAVHEGCTNVCFEKTYCVIVHS